MELFNKLNFKRFFTLIELIVVIVVLGVLAAIVIPNISSFKEEAQRAAIIADTRNIQTAVDMFTLDYHGLTPTKNKATLGNPQIVELYGLKGDYLRNLPKENSAKFWLDESNTVWGSTVDAPVNVFYDNERKIISWDTVDGAILYKIYKSSSELRTAASSSKLTFVKDIPTEIGSKQENELEPLEKGIYLVTAIDRFDNESAPTGAGLNYEGYGDGPDKKFNLNMPENKKPEEQFSSATFTNAGAIGRFGPQQSDIDTAYVDTILSGKVTSNSGIQSWTVPMSGIYHIEAYGAKGGSLYGGKGAIIKGDFELVKGQELKVVVGQSGLGSKLNQGGGGGGGSFVATSSNTPLIVAGGGGGGSGDNKVFTPYYGDNASTSTFGTSTYDNGRGRNGNGGSDGKTNGEAAGGGGFFTNGLNSTSDNVIRKSEGGKSFLNGSNGGLNGVSTINGTYNGGDGGFGGGGGGFDNSVARGGGGGGYSGGQGGTYSSSPKLGHGGGGGSYNSGTNQSNTVGNSGQGKVIFTLKK